MAGSRINFTAGRSANPFIKFLAGPATSARSPGGLGFMIGAGTDLSGHCRRDNPNLTCVIGFEASYRSVPGDRYLSGFQSLLRVGIGF